MIISRGLSFSYPDRPRPALKELDFTITRGESVLVLGPSGSGKSTLTLALNGLIPHAVDGHLEGSVSVGGRSTVETPVAELAQRVGVVFQDPESQFCTLTVEDEVAFGLENLRMPAGEIEERIDEALMVVGLAGFRRRMLSTLSGGEKQRVALASVLAMGPQVLVLDEPSANLDPKGTRELFNVVRRLATGNGLTLVLIEHKLEYVAEWIDSLLVLDAEGKLVFRGDPRVGFYDYGGVFAQAGIWRPRVVELVEGLGRQGHDVPGRPLGPAAVAEALRANPSSAWSMLAAGRIWVPDREPIPDLEDHRDGRRPPLVDIRSLSYRYRGSEPVLRNITAQVPRGSVTAIVGGNGAGKTTLASLLSGVLLPPKGSVLLEGEDITAIPPQRLADRMGHVFQNPEHQFVSHSVRGEIAFSLACLLGTKTLPPEREPEVDAWLTRFGLRELAEVNPFTLSQGQKRRLSVAAMVVRAQWALVLDEPTFGQDEAHNVRLMASLRELQARGRTIIMVTHDMDLVSEHAEHLLVLREGELAYSGSPRAFFGQTELVEACDLELPLVERVSALLGAERVHSVALPMAGVGRA